MAAILNLPLPELNAEWQLWAGNLVVQLEAADLVNSEDLELSNTGVEYLTVPTTANEHLKVGKQALENVSTGLGNHAIGFDALGTCTTGNYNYAWGNYAMNNLLAGYSNVAVGEFAGDTITSGFDNVLMGNGADVLAAGFNQIVIGDGASIAASNTIRLGNASITKFECQVALTVTSDLRDKIDLQPLALGLEFLGALEPKTFRVNPRQRYFEKAVKEVPMAEGETRKEWKARVRSEIKDKWTDLKGLYEAGTLANVDRQAGFIAQQVEQVTTAQAVEFTGLTETDTVFGFRRKGLTYEEFIPVLVNAVKELKVRIEALEEV